MVIRGYKVSLEGMDIYTLACNEENAIYKTFKKMCIKSGIDENSNEFEAFRKNIKTLEQIGNEFEVDDTKFNIY